MKNQYNLLSKKEIKQFIQKRDLHFKNLKECGIQTLNQSNAKLSTISSISNKLKDDDDLIEIIQLITQELQEKEYCEIKCVAKGAQGLVFVAKMTSNGLRCAIKATNIMNKNGLNKIDQKALQKAKDEAQFLKQCKKSPYVVQYHREFQGNMYYYIQLEQCIGTLEELLKVSQLNEQSLIKYARDICFGLGYAHSKNLVVKDLKPDNILITYLGNACLCDLGMSEIVYQENNMYAQYNNGNILYRAPETMLDIYGQQFQSQNIQTSGKQTKRSDSYSLGLLMYSMIEGLNSIIPLFSLKDKEIDNFKNIKNYKYQEEIKNIILSLTQFDPKKRMLVQDAGIILNNMYFYEISQENCQINLQQISLFKPQGDDSIEYVMVDEKQCYPIINNNTSYEIQEQIEESKNDIKIEDSDQKISINNLMATIAQKEFEIKKLIYEKDQIIEELSLTKAQHQNQDFYAFDFLHSQQDQNQSIYKKQQMREEFTKTMNNFCSRLGIQFHWDKYEEIYYPHSKSLSTVGYAGNRELFIFGGKQKEYIFYPSNSFPQTKSSDRKIYTYNDQLFQVASDFYDFYMSNHHKFD